MSFGLFSSQITEGNSESISKPRASVPTGNETIGWGKFGGRGGSWEEMRVGVVVDGGVLGIRKKWESRSEVFWLKYKKESLWRVV